MIIIDSKDTLIKTIFRQLDSMWISYDKENITESVDEALLRMNEVLQGISRNNKYIWKDQSEPSFTYYNSIQYSCFLYLLSNTIFKKYGSTREADFIYYLNKSLNSCDWFYAIDLPSHFYGEHPLGSVLGRAKYGDRFFIYQGCTVGGQRDKEGSLHYPEIGCNVLMYSNSSIIGKSVIGDNVILSVDTTVRNEIVPSNSIVFGQSPNLVIKSRTEQEILNMQKHIWEV